MILIGVFIINSGKCLVEIRDELCALMKVLFLQNK